MIKKIHKLITTNEYFKQFSDQLSQILSRSGNASTYAEEIMSTSLVTIHKDATYRRAVELLTENQLTVLPVIREGGEFLGLLTEREILKATSNFDGAITDFLDRPIHFKKSVKVISPRTTLNQVGRLLANQPFRHIPVVGGDRHLQGIITRRDLIRILYFRIELSKAKKEPLV